MQNEELITLQQCNIEKQQLYEAANQYFAMVTLVFCILFWVCSCIYDSCTQYKRVGELEERLKTLERTEEIKNRIKSV